MPNGILIVDKPAGWTSQDVAAKLRGVFHEKRVGHGGTLDPMATGVLPIFLGRATRAVPFFEHADKVYEAELRLGLVTDTQDVTGRVLEEHTVDITYEQLEAALSKFRGEIQQIPPMYSAIKVNGQKLYALARQGKEIERAPRPVTIYELALVGAASQGISSGSQIEDLGRHLIGRPQGVEVQSAVGDDKPPLLAGHNSPGDCCGFYRQCGSWADATGNNSTGDRPQGRWRGPADDRAIPCLERTVKKLLARLGEEDFFLLLALKRADSLAHHPDYRGRTAACDRMEALARELLARQEAFSLKDLAVKGSDLLALGIPKGPEIGKILNALLESVLAGELPNEREALLGKATRIK